MSLSRNIPFEKRVGKIVRMHRKLARGSVAHVGPDGLVTVRPRRTGLRMPWQGVILVIVILLLTKAGLYAHLGAQDYADKIVELQAGTAVEQAGAWMMKPDLVTVSLAELIAPYLP